MASDRLHDRTHVVQILAGALRRVELRAVGGVPEADTFAAAEELFQAIEPLVAVRLLCPDCSGVGWVVLRRSGSITRDCRTCDGTGRVDNDTREVVPSGR